MSGKHSAGRVASRPTTSRTSYEANAGSFAMASSTGSFNGDTEGLTSFMDATDESQKIREATGTGRANSSGFNSSHGFDICRTSTSSSSRPPTVAKKRFQAAPQIYGAPSRFLDWESNGDGDVLLGFMSRPSLVFVFNGNTGEKTPLQVALAVRVFAAKKMIETFIGFPAEHMRLSYRGKILDNRRTLLDSGVEARGCLHATGTGRQGHLVELSVSCIEPNAKCGKLPFSVCARPCDLIIQVKQQIAKVTGLAIRDQRITLAGKTLANESRLCDCGVNYDGCMLQVFRPTGAAARNTEVSAPSDAQGKDCNSRQALGMKRQNKYGAQEILLTVLQCWPPRPRYKVSLQAASTILQVKERLEMLCNVRWDRQLLQYRGVKLNDSMTLGCYNLEGGECLELAMQGGAAATSVQKPDICDTKQGVLPAWPATNSDQLFVKRLAPRRVEPLEPPARFEETPAMPPPAELETEVSTQSVGTAEHRNQAEDEKQEEDEKQAEVLVKIASSALLNFTMGMPITSPAKHLEEQEMATEESMIRSSTTPEEVKDVVVQEAQESPSGQTLPGGRSDVQLPEGSSGRSDVQLPEGSSGHSDVQLPEGSSGLKDQSDVEVDHASSGLKDQSGVEVHQGCSGDGEPSEHVLHSQVPKETEGAPDRGEEADDEEVAENRQISKTSGNSRARLRRTTPVEDAEQELSLDEIGLETGSDDSEYDIFVNESTGSGGQGARRRKSRKRSTRR